MICPVCFKNEATETVYREFPESSLSFRVCPDCFYRSIEMSDDDFYYFFLERPSKRCPDCGRSLREILSTMLVGCPTCYREFSKELKPLIDSVQGKR